MKTSLVIVGAGGHGRECLSIAEAMIANGSDLSVRGFVDDRPTDQMRDVLARRGHAILGGLDDLLAEPGECSVCIGIGDGQVRSDIDARLRRAGIPSAVLVHPDSTVGHDVALSPGCVIFAGARLTTNIKLGRHVQINQNATVGHDSLLDDYATINPMAAISGNVHVGAAGMVGAGAVILQGLSVGARARIGASACVVRDVPEDVTVKGVPAS